MRAVASVMLVLTTTLGVGAQPPRRPPGPGGDPRPGPKPPGPPGPGPKPPGPDDGPVDSLVTCNGKSNATETQNVVAECLALCCAPEDGNCVCWNRGVFKQAPPQTSIVVKEVDAGTFCKYHKCMHTVDNKQCTGYRETPGYKEFVDVLGNFSSSSLLRNSAAACTQNPGCKADWRQASSHFCFTSQPCLREVTEETCSQDCVQKAVRCYGDYCGWEGGSFNAFTVDECVSWYPQINSCNVSNVTTWCAATLASSSSSTNFLIPVIVGSVAFVLVCIAAICFVRYYQKRKTKEVIKVVNVKSEKDTAPILAALDRGDWSKGKILGKGQFGTVFLALLPDGAALACKQLNLGGLEEAAILRYMKEAVTMRELKHDNIVRLYYTQYNREEGVMLLFMEYVQGGSLGRLVRSMDSHLSEGQAVAYLRQILKGLQYLHSHGIVHRDIKGDNVLVDTVEGECKISDFGSSKNVNALVGQEQMATITGTPNWMAPEMITNGGKTEYDEKVDIWSIGCTAVELLNKGRPPWPEFSTQWAAIYHIANTDAIPDIPPNLSAPCQNFILRCLKRNPAERPTASELLEHEWMTMDFAEASEAPSVELPSRQIHDMNDEMRGLMARASTTEDNKSKSPKESLDTAVSAPEVRDSCQTAPSMNTSVEKNAGASAGVEEVEFEMKPFHPTVDNGSVLIGTMPSYVQREAAKGMTEPVSEQKDDAMPSFKTAPFASPYGDDNDGDVDQVNMGTVPSAVVRGHDFSKAPQ